MSMNLALKKGKKTDHNTLYQTPTQVTNRALDSGNPLGYYKNWVLCERQGKFAEDTKKHFDKIDSLLQDGWVFVVT